VSTDTAAAGVRRATVRVRYAETDKMGVVYYANYLVWFEVGRTDWLRQAGWTYRDMEASGVSLPVIEAHCEYRQPARYDDEIGIDSRAVPLSPVRLRFEYRLIRLTDGTLLAEGYTVHAAVDEAGRPCRLPEPVRSLLEPPPPVEAHPPYLP
jgi:acyl-CoA thioester hydrolase